MSWNATIDRLKAQAQQYGLASDYVTAKLLYQAVDEIERIARERDEARAQADGLADAHGKNAHDGAKARGTVGKGHHCAWREVAEAMEQRARAALAALPTAPKLTTVETWAGGELLHVHTEAASPKEDDRE